MKKFLQTSLLLTLLSGAGCIMPLDDDTADLAVAKCAGLKSYRNDIVKLDTALNMTAPELHNQVRYNFAVLCSSRKLQKIWASVPEKVQPEIVRAEKARIKLNCLLGYHPEIQVRYDASDGLKVPANLPTVSAAWKTAFILDAGKCSPQKLLEKVFTAHLDAVAAYDRYENFKFPDEASRIRAGEQRSFAVIKLAETIGISFYTLPHLEAFEERFDRAVEAIHR